MRKNGSCVIWSFFQVTSVEKRASRKHSEVSASPRLQKPFSWCPFFNLGNLEKTSNYTWTIFSHSLSEQLWQQNTNSYSIFSRLCHLSAKACSNVLAIIHAKQSQPKLATRRRCGKVLNLKLILAHQDKSEIATRHCCGKNQTCETAEIIWENFLAMALEWWYIFFYFGY